MAWEYGVSFCTVASNEDQKLSTSCFYAPILGVRLRYISTVKAAEEVDDTKSNGLDEPGHPDPIRLLSCK
jgi:hypothetical protein